jgi:hypothetical protein
MVTKNTHHNEECDLSSHNDHLWSLFSQGFDLSWLLDPQLMTKRKQLVAKLQAGSIDTAFTLGQAVVAMEQRYFPEPAFPMP